MVLGNEEGKGKNLAKTGKNGKLLLNGPTIGMERDRWQNYINKLIFKVNCILICEIRVFDIYFTEFGADLITVLPVLFKYCCKYCYSDSRILWAVMKGGGLAL